MRITKRRLRRLIHEACGLAAGPTAPSPADNLQVELPAVQPTSSVPVPEDYDQVRDLLEQTPDLVDLAISSVMDMAGTSCERSTAQGIIDHLQDMVKAPKAKTPVSPALGGFMKGPGF